jgi:Photosynthetic reaction centre cytochrome C subunit
MKKSLFIIAGCITSIILFQAFTIMREPHFKNLQILPKDISDHDLDSVMHHFSLSLGVKCNFCHVVDTAARRLDAASDAKPEKNIARKMMLMAIDINKNYFKGMEQMDMDHDHNMNNPAADSVKVADSSMDKNKEHMMDTSMAMESSKYMLRSVTCYTCHRGDAHPETIAPPHKEGPPVMQPKAPDKKK